MKKIFTLLIIALIFNFQLAAQAEKTLVKSVELDGNVAIATILGGNVNVTEWEKDFIRVKSRIGIENSSTAILERLVAIGRYELKVEEKNGELILLMPKTSKPINLKGSTLLEQFDFEISVPKHVSIRTINTSTEGI